MIRRLLTFLVLLLAGIQLHGASPGTGDFNTNQFAITGLSKVSLRNSAIFTNVVFNGSITFTNGTNWATYKFPATNCVDGQWWALAYTGTNEWTFYCTNILAPNIVVNTIEELKATPVPAPGINYIGRVLDGRGGDLVYLPNSTETETPFNFYTSDVGPGQWVRFPYSQDIRLEHGAVTGFDPTNSTLTAALAIQSTNGYGMVRVSGSLTFLAASGVALLDNNKLYFEEGAQATGLSLSGNGKTNIAIYGGNFFAEVGSETVPPLSLTNVLSMIVQSPKFTGYTGETIHTSGVNEVNGFFFGSDGFRLLSGNAATNFFLSATSGYSGTGTNFLADDGLFKAPVAVGSGTTINPSNSRIPSRLNATTFEDSPFYFSSGIPSVVALISPVANSPNLILQGVNTNAATGFMTMNLADSDGQQDAVYINGGKLSGWDAGTPGTRDGVFSINVLSDNSMRLRFEIDGDASGNTLFIGPDGSTIIGSIAGVSGYGGTGANFLSDDGTYKVPGGGGGGTTINPTDGFMPYRFDSGSFSNSPLRRIDANTVDLGTFQSDGRGIRFEQTDEVASIGVSLFGDGPGAIELNIYTNQSSILIESEDGVFVGGITLWTEKTNSYFNMTIDNVEYVRLNPATDGISHYFLSSFFPMTSGNLFEVQNAKTNIFAVASISGWTGTGTNFFADDGTFKPGTGGGSGITGSGTAPFIPVWTAGTVLGDSPITVPSTNSIQVNYIGPGGYFYAGGDINGNAAFIDGNIFAKSGDNLGAGAFQVNLNNDGTFSDNDNVAFAAYNYLDSPGGTGGAYFQNASWSILGNSYGSGANYDGQAIGVFGYGNSKASTNYAVVGYAPAYRDGAAYVGVSGMASHMAADVTNSIAVGGYFEITHANPLTLVEDPVFEEAVVLADNRDSGSPLFIGRTNNGTTVFKVDGIGNITTLRGLPTSFPGTNAVGVLSNDGSGNLDWLAGGGTGDFVGPSASTDNAIVRFDATTGKLGQNSVVTISDIGDVTGVKTLVATNEVQANEFQVAITGGSWNPGIFNPQADIEMDGFNITNMNFASFKAGTNIAQFYPSTTSTFPQIDRSVDPGVTMSSLNLLLHPHQDFNIIQEPIGGGAGGMLTLRGTQGIGFIPNINGPDYGTNIGGFQYRTPVESMSNNFFIFRGGQYLFENDHASWMVSMTPSGMNIGSPAHNTSIPLSMLEVWGGASIGKSYARTNAAPTDGLIVQGRIGAGIAAPGYPIEIASNDSTSMAYQRTGVSAKKWGFTSDNSFTYWSNLTDGTSPLSLGNAGAMTILGNLTANGVTYQGTPSTTMTFPATSATIARTDAAQTFTGTQAFGAITATTVAATGLISTSQDVRVGAGRDFYWDTRSSFKSPADGQILFVKFAGSDFDRLDLGGTSASFPAVGRSTEYINIVDAAGGNTSGLMINSGTPILGVLSATATLDFGSILAASSADLTITVTGAAVGDSVHLGLPAAPDTSVTFNGFVSAANTVTVRGFNIGAIAADPASATYRATVMKF